ncbi:MAG: HWE histidine kinase domain-containing protein [Kiloniellales bacterium]|nr:HWE histidine kinase domain-containing protein [Kiloniellales bacterium]
MTQVADRRRWLASRQFVQSVLDALPQHVAVLDERTEIVTSNAAWRRFGRANGLDERTAGCLGSNYLAICEQASGRHAEGAAAAAAGIRAVAEGRQADFELEYPCPSPTTERWFIMRVSRFEGAGRIWLVVAHENITQRRLVERTAREAAEQRELALEAADLGTWDNDLVAGRISWDARCRAILGAVADPADLEQALAIVHPDDRPTARRALEAALGPEGAGHYDLEKRVVRPDGSVRWVSARGRVLFADAEGTRRPVRTTGVIADVTGRRQAEERQQLLLRELNHRVRNVLATVQAVASRTLHGSASLEEFERAFGGRLNALVRTYTLIGTAEWQAMELRSLVEEALAPYRDARSAQTLLSGDDIRLPARMAQPLSLVLHELATNAAKYGALSVAGGRVAVDWRRDEGAAGRRLVLEWREHGGPQVAPPERHGFGRSLIERSIAYELDGEARLEFAPEGVRCRIEAPLAGPPDG